MPSPYLFIFEMANNHMGDVAHGERIICELRDVCEGFDFRFAIKLQYRDLPTLIHPAFRNQSDLRFVKRFNETALSWEQLHRMKKSIVANGFIPICTPFDEASVDKIVEHEYEYLKVASCSLTDWPLAEQIAATNLPVILSTAGESFEDIDRVVSFYQHREKPVSILHCVGEYPTAAADMQLNQIDLLARRYTNVTVGFSTHESPEQLDAIKMAVAKGACIFEKHVGVPTASAPLNQYSATPDQIRAWISAAREAIGMAGSVGRRHHFSQKETSTLSELRRGVYASKLIPAGALLTPANLVYAIPNVAGQLSANELSKYTEYRATTEILNGGAVMKSQVNGLDTRSAVHGIVREVKSLLRVSEAAVPNQLELEISHHYGIENFRETGSAMITVINREYCKRLVLMLPGQNHPEHWHKFKDETFHILYGDIYMELGGVPCKYTKNDVIVIPRGVKHRFGTLTGAVIEEISSTHTKDDSGYSDPKIGKNDQRKTYVTNWMD